MKSFIKQIILDDSGSITTLTVILLAVFLGLMAVVIDLGHLFTVQNELRNAADACALRGARGFYPDSIHGLENADQPDPNNAKNQASVSIGDNRSDNVALQDLPTGEIQVGIWDYQAQQLTPWRVLDSSDFGKYVGPGINLRAKRDASHNQGPVNMTLANVFGITSVPVRDAATAALSGMGGPVPGSPTLPFGSWDNLLTGAGQLLHGTFNRDGSDTLGWSNLDPDNTNPSSAQLKNLLTDPTGASTPNCPTGSTVGINNGQVAAAISAMTKSGNRFGLVETPAGSKIYVPSTATNPLTNPPVSYADTIYMMPVYADNGSGDKFNQSAVVGAVPIQICKVATSPGNSIDLKIVAGGPYIAPGYGGGKYYGILSTEPSLVQ
jgi:hypothetical protein